jgi:hypothetical protein
MRCIEAGLDAAFSHVIERCGWRDAWPLDDEANAVPIRA